MIAPYVAGFALYCLSVALSYSDKAKASAWYYPLGLALAFAANYLWLYIAKTTPEKSQIYLAGLLWDSMIVGCYVLIPVLFYGVRFGFLTALGICLVVSGLILTKV